ncbi:hypothetical protein SCUP234_07105 [Seiridium cupressi]
MSHPAENTSLCERCNFLSFDDSAIGGREAVDEDGLARLSFEDAKVQWRPEYYQEDPDKYGVPDYRLIRLEWSLVDTLPDMPHLSRSCQSGCAFCTALRCELEKTLVDEARYYSIQDGPLTLTMYLSMCEGGVEGFMVEGIFNQTEVIYRDIKIYFPIESTPSCQKWLRTEPIRDDCYLTPANILQMCQLLEECTATCHPWKTSFLPTRLIDVGADSSDIPHLVLSSNISITEETKYAALSYCWGSEEDAKAQLKTEIASLALRCREMQYEIMTPVISDAVALTRAIGLRYLWVDALCIVQDDMTDWSRESCQMDRVYRHAFVTFCGLNSDSCHETLLQRTATVRVPFQSTIRPIIFQYLYWIVSPPDGAAEGGPTKKKHCPPGFYFLGVRRFISSAVDALYDRIAGIKRGDYPARSLYHSWNSVIHSYSIRSVTQHNDRLPAISGLAQLVWDTLGDQYLAGIWKGDLLLGLSFIPNNKSTLCGLQSYLQDLRERRFIAPSWSWAACEGDVSMVHREGWQTVSEATVREVNVETKFQNPFGQIFGGSIEIYGKVASIPSLLPQSLERRNERSKSWRLDIDDEGLDENILAWLGWLSSGEEEGVQNLVMLLLFRYQEESTGDASSQQNHTDTSISLDEARKPELCALILHPADIPAQYYRVGVIHSEGQAGYNLMRSWFDGSSEELVCII